MHTKIFDDLLSENMDMKTQFQVGMLFKPSWELLEGSMDEEIQIAT